MAIIVTPEEEGVGENLRGSRVSREQRVAGNEGVRGREVSETEGDEGKELRGSWRM